MIVKLVVRGSSVGDEGIWRNQCQDIKKSIFGDCIFTFDPAAREYDWLVIIDDVPRVLKNKIEKLACPDNNTILITSEPSSIARYGKNFAKQFKYIITNHGDNFLPHNNAIRSQTGNVWYYGKSYEDIIKEEPNKNKLISTVCSSKQQGHTIHKKRFEFISELQKELPNMDRFGKGIKWIDHKYEAIDPYKFHIAIENQYSPDVWTEKLADTFLGYAVPIYFGCPNIADYFPEDSYIQIDINNFDESLRKIKEIINTEGEYERRLPAVKEARRKVLEEYNMLAMIDNIIKNDKSSDAKISNGVIYNREIMRFKNPADLVLYVFFRVSNFLKDLPAKIK